MGQCAPILLRSPLGGTICSNFAVFSPLGGTMCSNYAANAPVFFFHHGFLDNIWYRWQQRHPACIRTYYDKHPVHLVGSKYESKYFVDSHDQGESVKVKYEDFLTGRVDPKIFRKSLAIVNSSNNDIM